MNELLNEENYQRANKKVRTIGIIIMLLGLLLIGGGIYFLITAHNMTVPEIGDSNWYHASSNQMSMQSSGMFMIIPGIFLTLVGLIVRFVVGNQRNIMAYQMQQMMPLVKEGAEKITPVAKKMADEFKDDKW